MSCDKGIRCCIWSQSWEDEVNEGDTNLWCFDFTFCCMCSQSSLINGNKSTDDSGSLATECAQTNTSGDLPRRYCPCCYCELFGNNGVSL